jgi:AcrR family transcriptional regulator
MDDIAERAGVSKPVLYQHFPGKLDLYLALLDQHAEALLAAVRAALESTSDNKQRVAATIEAYFRFVDEDGGAFRLVFESDLTNQSEVRERVDGVTAACAEAISEVIREDAGLPDEAAMLLAVGLSGMAQVSARYWLATEGSIPRDAAARLLASLSWRGIGGFPRTGEAH